MGKYAFLVMVTKDNNNKFYEMVETDNGDIQLFNGRVDVSRVQQPSKPSHEWEKIYRSKIKKGYADITEMVSKSESKTKKTTNYVDIHDKEVQDVISKLLAYSNKTIEENYKVKANSVTQKQVDEAQRIIDEISRSIRKGAIVKDINTSLLQLYTIIPRKMDKVVKYLLKGEQIGTKTELDDARQFISKEQDILDSMASSVIINDEEESDESMDENKTILDTLGIEIEPASDEDIKNIKNHLGDIKDKFKRAFKVKNLKTENIFNDWLKTAKNPEVKLFWHGSRNENFISIMQKGLMIRPSGVIITGSMYGSQGVYFADKARKSYGYTSGKNSYWAKGNSNIAYMAIFKVHVGKQWQIRNHESYCYNLDERIVNSKGFDSVWALKGADLMNDEFIIYNSKQCTIKYLVELEG